jgi:hypothetical protein
MGPFLISEITNVVGPTSQAFSYRLSAGQTNYPSGTFQIHDLNDPRVMLIPMVDWSGVNGNSQVPLKGFAMMWTVSEDSAGQHYLLFYSTVDPAGRAGSERDQFRRDDTHTAAVKDPRWRFGTIAFG